MKLRLRSKDLAGKIRDCVACRTKKNAANPGEHKPEIVITPSPRWLVVVGGNGSKLATVDWFLKILKTRYGVDRSEVQVVPLLWCDDIKLSVPSTRNCLPWIFHEIDKKNLSGIFLVGRDSVRYFLGRGATPPQPALIHGREVRVADIPYPLFLMPDADTLAAFDPVSQSLRNARGDLRERLSTFIRGR